MSYILGRSFRCCGTYCYWKGDAKIINGVFRIFIENALCEQACHFGDIREYDHHSCGDYKQKQ